MESEHGTRHRYLYEPVDKNRVEHDTSLGGQATTRFSELGEIDLMIRIANLEQNMGISPSCLIFLYFKSIQWH